ncbi:hypothetical protein [Nocardia donostiensis]|uniref:SCP2 domain-containing protein n=1 Tax=Nocardia donostiensis TaxID=1538463 RepID=A0A1V2TJX0_9NOCA|nr:hypothetical protein [Nocardia donostiensis]ONM49804.1 hypothetical protein B0T46_05210 [Nocardia donostiensis]OQS22240.1 hypothetical protein B0T44_06320 [Nocardia donostiensis]
MTETTIGPATRGVDAIGGVDIRIEDDASPITRLIGRTITDSLRADSSLLPGGLEGAIAVRSHDTPQAATISIANGTVAVSSGVFVEPDLTLTVDLNQRFAPVGEPVGAGEFAGVASALLSPPLPDWKTAAATFWAAARSIPGIPDVLVATTEGPEGLDQVVVGEGETHYVIAGPPELLAGIFSGTDDLVAALSTGLIGVRGTFSQLSMLVAASWKVRYDV